jgi:threonyl-tRNA synthetase
LPLRYAEFGVVHRNEPSGTLHGLFRLREFTQDDGHVFCSKQQIDAEVLRFIGSLSRCYQAFGFAAMECAFATRPAERAGSESAWDEAEQHLRRAAVAAGIDCIEARGAGAFYGPKLEFSLLDRAGRRWQCGTIQLDLVLPERFDVAYINSSSEKCRPALLHRAVLGSLERFLGILLEHHRGKLPIWLVPEQVAVLPVREADHDAARAFEVRLEAQGMRARVAAGPESLSRRVLAAHERGTPFIAVIGERERATHSVALRSATCQQTLSEELALAELAARAANPI